jgi:hypothetical protein
MTASTVAHRVQESDCEQVGVQVHSALLKMRGGSILLHEATTVFWLVDDPADLFCRAGSIPC